MSGHIVTRCPSCGCQTLFVGNGGHLTCSWIKCPNPAVGEAIDTLKANTVVLRHIKTSIETSKVLSDEF